MDVEIKMPKCGMSMMEGEVVTWFKKEGDKVENGEEVLEFSENKAVHSIESDVDGVLDKILVQEGERAPIGATLGIIRA